MISEGDILNDTEKHSSTFNFLKGGKSKPKTQPKSYFNSKTKEKKTEVALTMIFKIFYGGLLYGLVF